MAGKHRKGDDEEEISSRMTESELRLKEARVKGEIKNENEEFPPKRGKLTEEKP